MLMALIALSGAASACEFPVDDPWLAWRAPSVAYMGKVRCVTVVGQDFASVEISIAKGTSVRRVTVQYPVQMSTSPALPVEGEHVLVAARPARRARYAPTARRRDHSCRRPIGARRPASLTQPR